MPRLPRARTAAWLAAAALAAAVPPRELHGDLASAAGTLFEAAPFVLIAALVSRLGGRPVGQSCGGREAAPRCRLVARLVPLLGCGCGGPPGALALPAVAVCWLAFGPAVALARTAAGAAAWRAGIAAAARRAGGRGADAHPSDPLAEIAAIVPAAIAGPILAAGLAHLATVPSAPVGLVAELIAGALVGAVVPCATAGVALAASLRSASPAAAAGLLATAGVVRLAPALRSAARFVRARVAAGADPARRARTSASVPAAASPRRTRAPRTAPGSRATPGPLATPEPHREPAPSAALGLAALACALGTLAVRGPSGLVNARLVPVVALGALAAAGLAIRRERTRAPAAPAVGFALLAALAMGSPEPRAAAEATTLGDAWAGESLAFTGTARRTGAATTLERFAITCCRADAAPVAVRLARALPIADGSWVAADGELVDVGRDAPAGAEPATATLELHVAHWRAVAPPADPFLYR